MEKNYSTGNCPVAFIAKDKQRIKQYGSDTVYLKNEDNFQVELFNPTKTKVLARIEMNQKSIGPGIILRPGERVFLERYVSEARKFKFETYTVNGNNEEVKKAIEDNGDVVVKFYKEQETPDYNYVGSTITITNNPFMSQPFFYSTGDFKGLSTTTSTSVYNSNSATLTNTSSLKPMTLSASSNDGKRSKLSKGVSNEIATASCCMDSLCMDSRLYSQEIDLDEDLDIGISSRGISKTKEIETGRVEKGSSSKQTFEADYTKFYPSYTWKSEWKILPESRKPITADDLVVYCTSCGRRKGVKERYCPLCGNKF